MSIGNIKEGVQGSYPSLLLWCKNYQNGKEKAASPPMVLIQGKAAE